MKTNFQTYKYFEEKDLWRKIGFISLFIYFVVFFLFLACFINWGMKFYFFLFTFFGMFSHFVSLFNACTAMKKFDYVIWGSNVI